MSNIAHGITALDGFGSAGLPPSSLPLVVACCDDGVGDGVECFAVQPIGLMHSVAALGAIAYGRAVGMALDNKDNSVGD